MKYWKYEGSAVLGTASVLMWVASCYVIHPTFIIGCGAVAVFAFVLAVDLWPCVNDSEFLNSSKDRYGDDR